MSVIRKNIKFIKTASILTFYLFVANLGILTFTKHTHILPDGRIIEHSHLSKNSNEKSKKGSSDHTHSEKEFFYLSQICNQTGIITDPIKLNSIKNLETEIFHTHKFESSHQTIITNVLLRAPPSFFI